MNRRHAAAWLAITAVSAASGAASLWLLGTGLWSWFLAVATSLATLSHLARLWARKAVTRG